MQCEELPRARHGEKDESWAEKTAKINVDPTQLSHGKVPACLSKSNTVLLSRSDNDELGALIGDTRNTAPSLRIA